MAALIYIDLLETFQVPVASSPVLCIHESHLGLPDKKQFHS